MTSRQLILVHSTIYAVFAAALLLFPDQMWPLYGLDITDDNARFLSQHNSIFLSGIAILGFLFSDLEDNSPTQRRLLVGLIGTNLVGVAITLYACFTGIFTGLGWSDPAFLLALRLRRQAAPGAYS